MLELIYMTVFIGQIIGIQSDISNIVEPGEPICIADGLQFTEGPVWHHESYLLFSDIPANKIYKWSSDKKLDIYRSPSGNSNGLTLDQQGRLIACEHGNRRVSRTETDGQIVSLAEKYQGKRLNSPNDAVVKSDGSIYFTDPPYGVQPDQRELDFQGVYRIDPDGTLKLLADDFEKPNGIVFSPDEKILYVKRIIGLPGETVQIKDGAVFINGTKLDEPYLNEPMIGGSGTYKVPEGKYFMLGDNRNNSKDSRYWQNKYVSKDKILGKVVFRYFPRFKVF